MNLLKVRGSLCLNCSCGLRSSPNMKPNFKNMKKKTNTKFIFLTSFWFQVIGLGDSIIPTTLTSLTWNLDDSVKFTFANLSSKEFIREY